MKEAILLVWFLGMIAGITTLLLANLKSKKKEKHT